MNKTYIIVLTVLLLISLIFSLALLELRIKSAIDSQRRVEEAEREHRARCLARLCCRHTKYD